jgi:quercetin dioxygenase-like cupin family protein
MKPEIGNEPVNWPEHLDVLVAAPEHHEVLFENSRVRVLNSWIKPGDETPIHTHKWGGVLYILSTSDFVRFNANREVVYDSRISDKKVNDGSAIWSPPLQPHCVKNVGDNEIRVINVELKD